MAVLVLTQFLFKARDRFLTVTSTLALALTPSALLVPRFWARMSSAVKVTTPCRCLMPSLPPLSALDFGNDVLSFTAANAISSSLVYGGKQKDTITLNGVTGSLASIGGGGKGADVLALSQSGAMTNTNVGGGQGTDIIRATTAIASISGGGLSDTITLGTFAGGVIFGDAVGTTTAGTGTGGAADGGDQITINVANAAATSIYGGGGNDTIFFASGLNFANVVDAGDGNDSIRLVGSTTALVANNASIFGGASADTISLGANFVTAGDVGSQGTINGGAGADLIIYSGATGGMDVISFAGSALTGVTASLVLDGITTGDVLRIGNSAAVTANASRTGELVSPVSRLLRRSVLSLRLI